MIERNEQKQDDMWDLSELSKSGKDWDYDIEMIRNRSSEAKSYKGRLSLSADNLYMALSYIKDCYMELERLGSWAMLNYSVDSTNADVQKRAGIYQQVEAEFSSTLSFFEPELLQIDDEKLSSWLKEPRFEEYRRYIEKIRMFKEHILSEQQESLLALYTPLSDSAQEAFQDLNNIDMDFGYINGKKLTHSTFPAFMQEEDDQTREKAYMQLYGEYDKHKSVISRLYSSSIKNDIFLSKARGYKSSLEMALFADKIPESVYTSLIESIHQSFDIFHRYYSIRARIMGKESLRHWDVYLPLVKEQKTRHTYQEAVALIKEAVAPLGKEYQETLINGLTTEHWVDKYENKGKRSGAFSSGCYTGKPYILTNFEDEVISSVLTLIHEGGHSMHSYYSVRNNPFMSYNYTIFEAEVASTFNENLLFHYMIDKAKTKEEEAYLISKKLDDIVATLYRQTMFAEFELKAHQQAESGLPTTTSWLRECYRNLLEEYFGPIMKLEDVSDLEALRIPHFYRAFYCYKYATGISASIALSEKVLNGGEKERDDYLSFLKSGGSSFPLDALRKAGVDMSTTGPVKEATKYFKSLLDRFEALVP